MNPTAKIIGSAITAGLIAGGGALVTAMSNGETVTRNAAIAAILVGLVAAAKDWRTYLAKSPKEIT